MTSPPCPALVDLARLLALDEQVESGKFDAVVVDFPALRHTLDLLAALDAAARSLDRMFPERQPTMLDPFLRALSGAATDGEDVYERGRELLLRLSRLRGHAFGRGQRLACGWSSAPTRAHWRRPSARSPPSACSPTRRTPPSATVFCPMTRAPGPAPAAMTSERP